MSLTQIRTQSGVGLLTCCHHGNVSVIGGRERSHVEFYLSLNPSLESELPRESETNARCCCSATKVSFPLTQKNPQFRDLDSSWCLLYTKPWHCLALVLFLPLSAVYRQHSEKHAGMKKTLRCAVFSCSKTIFIVMVALYVSTLVKGSYGHTRNFSLPPSYKICMTSAEPEDWQLKSHPF